VRRTTAAVLGTVAGAALMLGVRLSATPVAVNTAGAAATSDTGEGGGYGTSTSGKKKKKTTQADNTGGSRKYKGDSVSDPYGAVRVSITVADGRITKATATYPEDGNSGVVNEPAVPKLNEWTVKNQNAKLDTVSGATYTSDAYRKSLQSAIDAAGL